MATAGAMNSGSPQGELEDEGKDIKQEEEVTVKPEPRECAVCAARCLAGSELCGARTQHGTPLTEFLGKFTNIDLLAGASNHVCKNCHDIIDVLESAEIEYYKLKEAFEAIISKNPLFDNSASGLVPDKTVKKEAREDDECGNHGDSEDEPLAITKKKRQVKRKKKIYTTAKRKARVKTASKDSCHGDRGGVGVEERVARAALPPLLPDVKKEDSVDGVESDFPMGVDGAVLKIEVDEDAMIDFGEGDDDDDDDSSFVPEGINGHGPGARGALREQRKARLHTPKTRKKREPKVMHQCDQCDAKYSSIKRLELHRDKHSAGKPPYICEVCGARYKHKRACDVHVALHRGISDWKCVECDKLFPSKGALQRHNNIHTGKLNYQCDLCGKSFIHTSSFKMHKLSHSGLKPHSCSVCGLALMTRSHLKRHERIHSGEKRHECAVCGKRFSERYNLAAHAKSHESAGAAPSEPRRRLFRCAFCQERFERRYMLERHTSVAHGCTLERAPPTPRNTMSKLLKAQAQARAPSAPADLSDSKGDRSPEPRSAPAPTSHKLTLGGAGGGAITAGSWSGAFAAEFGLRAEYPH